MSEIDNLLNELRNMKKQSPVGVVNCKDTWKKIQKGEFASLGFNSEAEMKSWILDNPYSNLG